MAFSEDWEHPLKEIKFSIENNDRTLWANQARIKYLNGASEKLIWESEYLQKDIVRLQREIGELEPLVKMVEKINAENTRTISNGYESIVHHGLYKQKLLDDLKEMNETHTKILKEYQEHIDIVMQHLEKTTPKYKLLQQKRTELRKVQVECKMLKHDIEERKKINKQRLEIRKKRFYAPIIALAQAWIDNRNQIEKKKKWDELCRLEQYWMKKVMDSTEELKKKQIEKLKNSRNEDIIRNLSELEKNEIVQPPVEVVETVEEDSSPFSDLKNLIDSAQVNSQHSEPSNVDNVVTKPIFNPSHSKVLVLENKVLKSVDMDKEKRRRLIDAKFQKVVNNLRRNRSKKNLSSNVGSNVNESSKMNTNGKDDMNESWTSQDLNNLSQENPLLTQESQDSCQGGEKLKPSGFLPENTGSKLNMKLSQTNTKRLSEMRFIPQPKQVNHTLEAKEVATEIAHGSKEKQGFEMKFPETKSLSQSKSQYTSHHLDILPGGLGSHFESSSQPRSASMMGINAPQTMNKKNGEMQSIPQGGFFNKGFDIVKSGMENKQNAAKKALDKVSTVSNNSNILFDNKSDSVKAMPVPPARNKGSEPSGLGNMVFMNNPLETTETNQKVDDNTNKDANLIPNMLNFGAPAQFNFGNVSQFLQSDNDVSYDTGFLSPQMEANFENPEEESQNNPSVFQFGNTGQGGGGFSFF